MMTRMVQANQLRKQPMIDLVVALISVPLLIVFGLMLQSNMRGDWTRDNDTRWRILGLGLSLLFVSLIMCLYITHRLGLCIWAAQQDDILQPRVRRSSQRGHNTHPLTSTGSQLQLMVSGELPPSYDAVMRGPDLPPPYCSLLICNEKNTPTGVTDGPPLDEKASHQVLRVNVAMPTPGITLPPANG